MFVYLEHEQQPNHSICPSGRFANYMNLHWISFSVISLVMSSTSYISLSISSQLFFWLRFRFYKPSPVRILLLFWAEATNALWACSLGSFGVIWGWWVMRSRAPPQRGSVALSSAVRGHHTVRLMGKSVDPAKPQTTTATSLRTNQEKKIPFDAQTTTHTSS